MPFECTYKRCKSEEEVAKVGELIGNKTIKKYK